MGYIISIAEAIASFSIPAAVCLCGLFMLFGKKDYFKAFTAGAYGGLKTTVGLLPTLCALLAAICMLKASGAVDFIASAVAPQAEKLGIPTGIFELLLTRPFSGSASTAVYSRIMSELGADSFDALCASVIMGSSDTVVYIITVYFSSVGIRKTRHAFPCAFAVMIFCVFFSCFICRLWFN